MPVPLPYTKLYIGIRCACGALQDDWEAKIPDNGEGWILCRSCNRGFRITHEALMIPGDVLGEKDEEPVH